MALDLEIARLSRILVDSEGISFDEAQSRLKTLTLEIIVGSDAVSPAAHAAVLTAVSVGYRTFVGGVRVTGAVEQLLNSSFPFSGPSLAEAAVEAGAAAFDGPASFQIVIGTAATWNANGSVGAWWSGWTAGTDAVGVKSSDDGANPLTGVAAGALAVSKAFEAKRRKIVDLYSVFDLWPKGSKNQKSPRFSEVFLPGAIWIIGLGNLGQAFLWSLASLPYQDPEKVSVVLQDRDLISPENWATSVLVSKEKYGDLKTRAGERWALAKGFDVRRIDRKIAAVDRLEGNDPKIALSGVDTIEARRKLVDIGFDCIIDAGLGRTAREFDRYRVTVFDKSRPIDRHFEGQKDPIANNDVPATDPYLRLEKEIGRCGAAEIAGASVAAPFVSALTAAIVISRLIAVTSGCSIPLNEVGGISSLKAQRFAPEANIDARGFLNAGKPLNQT